MSNRAQIRVAASIVTGLSVFVVAYLMLTAVLVATTPPDLSGPVRVAGLVALVVLPAAMALWVGRAVARHGGLCI